MIFDQMYISRMLTLKFLFLTILRYWPSTQELRHLWIFFLVSYQISFPVSYLFLIIAVTKKFLVLFRGFQRLPWWLRWYRIHLQCGRHRFDPWVQNISWRRNWQPIPVSLPGKFHGQRSLAGSSPWSSKQSDMTEQLTLHRGFQSFPNGSDGKVSACNVGDLGLIPGLGRSPGGGHGNPL